MSKKLLSTFEVMLEERKEKFSIYGEFKIEEGMDHNNKIYKYPEFFNVTASEVVEEQEKDYMPKGVSWSGVKYEPVDMIEDFLQNLIRNTDTYTEVYLDEELKKLVDYYKADSISLEEKTLPKRILGGVNMYPYEIFLATDKYVYYAYYDNYMVFDINDYSILANNEFAENSYMESIENIKNGTEKKLWEQPTIQEGNRN